MGFWVESAPGYAKAAVNCVAEVLIEENRGSGVHIMLVCPTLVDTPLLQQSMSSSNPRAIRESITNKRFASPEFIIDKVEQGLRRRTNKPGTWRFTEVWLYHQDSGFYGGN